MQAIDILRQKAIQQLISVHPDMTVFAAIQLLAQHNIGAVVVLEDDALVGMFSERDYTRQIALKERSSQTTRVREIMSTHLTTAPADYSVERCLGLMTDKRIRHLPVMAEGKLIGMLSIGDLVKAMIDKQQKMIEQLQSYISG